MFVRVLLSSVVLSHSARLDSLEETLSLDDTQSDVRSVVEQLAFDTVRQNTRLHVRDEIRNALKAPSPFRELKTKKDALEAFGQLDADGDGQMTKAELKSACEADVECKQKLLPQIDMVFKMMDASGSGTISEAEFVAFAVPSADAADVDEAAMAFRMMDDGSGCIKPEGLGKMLSMGAPPGQMKPEEVKMMSTMIVLMFDKDASGCLNLEEWRAFMDSAKEQREQSMLQSSSQETLLFNTAVDNLAFDAIRQNTRLHVRDEIRTALKAPSPFRDLKTKEDALAAFGQLDADGDGEMTKAELKAACEADETCKQKMLPQIDMVFKMMDASGSGTISEAEFVAFAVPSADAADVDEAAMAFRMMDDGSGCIKPEGLGKMLSMGAPPGQLKPEEVKMMSTMIVLMFDKDASGCLNLEEWRAFMDSAKEQRE